MQNSTLILISLLVVVSCSRVNVASQDYYRSKHIRHGVVPLSGSVAQKFNEASVLRGKALYTSHCMSCHGEKGLGDGPKASEQEVKPSNLQKLAKEVPNFKFFMSISQWQGDMPGWKEQFDDADRDDLVAYIKTFK